MIKCFYELKVWRDAHALTLKIYMLTKDFPREEQFGLVSQLRRASASIGANNAEGFGRFHSKDKARFYQQARGSALEVQNHVFLARDLNFLSKHQAEELSQEIDIVAREINGLIAAMLPQTLTPNPIT